MIITKILQVSCLQIRHLSPSFYEQRIKDQKVPNLDKAATSFFCFLGPKFHIGLLPYSLNQSRGFRPELETVKYLLPRVPRDNPGGCPKNYFAHTVAQLALSLNCPCAIHRNTERAKALY